MGMFSLGEEDIDSFILLKKFFGILNSLLINITEFN